MSFNSIMQKIGKGVQIANKIADTAGAIAKEAIGYAKTPIKDIEVKQFPIIGKILSTTSKVLKVAGDVVEPFRGSLKDIPFAGKFLDKAATILFDKVAPFMDKSLVGNISFLAKWMPTVEKVADFVVKAGKALDHVEKLFPAQQANAANIAAHRQAEILRAG